MATEENEDTDMTYHEMGSEDEEQYYSAAEESDDEEEYWSAQEDLQAELANYLTALVEAATSGEEEDEEAPLEVETTGQVPPSEDVADSPASVTTFGSSHAIQEVRTLRDICLAVIPAQTAPQSCPVPMPAAEEESVVVSTDATQDDSVHNIGHEEEDPRMEEPSAVPMKWKDLQFIRQLGHGNICRVSLVRHKTSGRLVVAKETFRGYSALSQHEIDFVRTLSGHPLFISAIDCIGIPEPDCQFVMEYFPGQTLDKYLSAHVLTFSEVQRVLRQLGEALGFVHSKNIIHMDVNPYNILVNEKLWCKLIDFNCALIGPHARGSIGTRLFYAPEVETYEWGHSQCCKKKKSYGFKVDYYSLGMTPLLMSANLLHVDFLRRVLIKKNKKRRNLPWIMAAQQEVSPEGPNDFFHDLLSRLLTQPKKRLGDKDFLKHPFFDEFFEVRLHEVQLDAKKMRRSACLHRCCIRYVNEPLPSKQRRKLEKMISKRNHAEDMVCSRTVQVAKIMKEKYKKPKGKSLWRRLGDCFGACFRRKKKNSPTIPEAGITEDSPQHHEENRTKNGEARPTSSAQDRLGSTSPKKKTFSFRKLFQRKKNPAAPSGSQ